MMTKAAAAAVRAATIACPAYLVAVATGEMVYVVPTLAATIHFAGALPFNVDDADGNNADDEDGGGEG